MMAPLRLFCALAAAGVAFAQSESDNDRAKSSSKVWAAVAYINHGEITPQMLYGHYGYTEMLLTPPGARQMRRQGDAFRNRYLTASSSGPNSTTSAPIQGLSKDAIENSNVAVLSEAASWVSAGALAFSQGLYPPNTDAFSDEAGGKALSEDFPAGNTTDYPLSGYQYPFVNTNSMGSPNSLAVEGHIGCAAWDNVTGPDLTNDQSLSDKATANSDFYRQLFSNAPLEGAVDMDTANFWNAYEIYQLVDYLYKHNETVYNGLEDAEKTLDTLRDNAFTLQRAKTQGPSSNSNDTESIIKTFPGRTLADAVATRMGFFVRGNSQQKLTLLFGSYQPLMAFYSIAGLQTRDNLENTPLGNVTAPGAAIVFELIGENPDDPNVIPETDDLRVRFLYRASADKDEHFEVMSLFGSGFDGTSIPYTAFLREMDSRGRNSSDWCDICKPASDVGPRCAVSDSAAHHKSSSQMNPAVAGVIGAIIMGGLIGLAGLGLFIGGYSVRRRNGEGLKRAEKRAGDRDVQVGNAGDHQERIGSWEMRDGHGAKAGGGDSTVQTDSRRNPFDDDAASDMGATPVKAREKPNCWASSPMPAKAGIDIRLWLVITIIAAHPPLSKARSMNQPRKPMNDHITLHEPSATPQFRYTAFKNARSIRILTLHPSADSQAPLRGDLAVQSLDDSNKSEEPYEAISYVWGDSSRSASLYCNSTALGITQSIHDALVRIRLPDAPRRLWADQVCINQDDVAERSQQVELMNLVYQNATQVLVWLGPDYEQLAADAVQMIMHLHGVFADDVAHAAFRKAHTEDLAKQDSSPWKPLAKLSMLPWFHRIWIAQEIGTGTPATLFWGDAKIDWDVLSEVVGVLNQRYHHLRTRFHIGTPNIRYLWRRFVEPDQAFDEFHNRGSFVYELHRARHMLAEDPRDRVYAFLGHFSIRSAGSSNPDSALANIVADYSRPVDEVYRDVAIRGLSDAKTLIILSATHCTLCRSPSNDSQRNSTSSAAISSSHTSPLPSWVPDWRNIARHIVGTPDTPHRAAGSTLPKLNIDSSSMILHIHGVHVDTISMQSWVINGTAFYFHRPKNDTTRRKRHKTHPIKAIWQTVCSNSLPISTTERYPTNEPAFSAFAQTLTNAAIGIDRTRDHSTIPAQEHMATAAAYLLRAMPPSEDSNDILSPDLQALAHESAGDAFKWCHEASLVTRYRRFAVSAQGYYVLGPDTMQEGDAVVVLYGGRTPFLLRRRDEEEGDGWVLVGECYMHGIMAGEALERKGAVEEAFSIF